MDFQEVKQAFISLYGKAIYNSAFADFDAAFKSAWDSFDFIAGATTPEEMAEGMTECWQLTES